jgi:hypothetical protein
MFAQHSILCPIKRLRIVTTCVNSAAREARTGSDGSQFFGHIFEEKNLFS